MTIYIILALSFAVMYHFRYIHEALSIVAQVSELHNAEGEFSPITYSIVTFVYTTLMAPIILYDILVSKRKDYIKSLSINILTTRFDLEIK